MAALNFALSFLRIVTLVGRLVKLLCAIIECTLCSKNKISGMWSVKQCLFLVFILCINEFECKISWLLTMTFISESMYWHGKGRISNCLNRLLHGVVCCVPAIILKTSYCKVKILRLLEELPQKIIQYFVVKWMYA
jgi:hypothetical protein